MKRIALAAVVTFVMALGTSTLVAQKSKFLSNATVKSVTATSLVVTLSGKDTTLAVDAKTHVVGKGVGTKSAALKGKASITDLLAAGDRVTVTYTDAGGTLHATKVEKAAPMK